MTSLGAINCRADYVRRDRFLSLFYELTPRQNKTFRENNGHSAAPTVVIAQAEYERLQAIAKQYGMSIGVSGVIGSMCEDEKTLTFAVSENLRRNLLRGGVGEDTVAVRIPRDRAPLSCRMSPH